MDGGVGVKPSHVVAAVAMSGLLVGGAVGSVSAAAGSPSGGITVAVNTEPVCIDPMEGEANVDIGIQGNIYQSLIAFNAQAQIVPQLAERYTVAANAKTITFYLNPKARFADGTPVNATAVKDSFAWLLDPAHHLPRAFLFPAISSIQVVNSETVRFVLAKPFGAIAYVFASPAGKVIELSALKKGEAYLCTNPIGGSGPFVFSKWVPDDFLTVTRNPHFWDAAQAAQVSSITYRPVIDASTAIAGLQTGEYQVVFPVPTQLVSTLKSDANLTVDTGPSTLSTYLMLNNLKAPFNNLDVRQAMNYAINAQAIVKDLWDGYGSIAHSALPKGVSFAIDAGTYQYDPAKAKELLKEAGYPHGFTTTLWTTNDTGSVELATAVQQMLGAVGITVHVEPLDNATLGAMEEASDVRTKEDMVLSYFSTSTFDADWELRGNFGTSSWLPTLFNGAFFSDKALDSLLAAGLSTGVPAQRAAIYSKAQKLVWNEAPWVFLPIQTNIWATASNIKGVAVRPDAVLIDNSASE
jgi:glutathione transport system substrate-binding protein